MRIILTSIIIGLLASCSADRQSTVPVVVSSSPAATVEGMPSMSYEQMLPEVARLSQEAGIPILKDASLTDAQTELRFWKGLGVVFPRCFVMKIDNGNPTATFATLKIVGNKGVFRKGNPIYVNTPLNAPHSGWPNLLAYLKQNGIDSSINLATDKRFEPYPDAEHLILEMKTGARHTLAHYIDSTVTEDGKKALAVCEKIENEFDIRLACKS